MIVRHYFFSNPDYDKINTFVAATATLGKYGVLSKSNFKPASFEISADFISCLFIQTKQKVSVCY